MSKPKFRDIDRDSDCPDQHMPWDEFMDNVRIGAYTDDDGHAEYATADKASDVAVSLVDVFRPNFQPPEWATHVVWYGK